MDEDPNERAVDNDMDDLEEDLNDDIVEDDEDEAMWDDEDEEDDNDERWEELQAKSQREFTELCTALERNDDKQTALFAVNVKGHGLLLGRALVGNTHVQHMSLRLAPEYIHAPGENGMESIALLLQYMREGPVLRTFHFWKGSVTLYMRPCLQALSQNPHVRSVTFDAPLSHEIPHDELGQLLRATRSLESLSMPMINSPIVTEAIATNQTLCSMGILYDPTEFPAQSGAMLSSLASHSTFRHLSLCQASEPKEKRKTAVDVALFELLQTTTSLTHLTLVALSFSAQRMRLLMQGLQSNRSLSHLSLFSSCVFDDAAVDEAESLLRAATNGSLSIVDLTVEESDAGDASSASIAALLAVACSRHLKTLHWNWSHESNAGLFWSTLERHASKLYVQEIRSFRMCLDGIPAMASCVPKLRHLRELHLGWLYFEEHPDIFTHFTDMVRKSGSLQVVPYEPLSTGSSMETQADIIEASLERNRTLPRLLAGLDSDAMTDSVCDEPSPTEPSLVPSLMLSAVQAPQLAPNQILTGLFALSESVRGTNG